MRVFDSSMASSVVNSLLDADVGPGSDQPLTFTGHRGPVSCVRFSSSGDLLASGGSDGSVVVWDVVDETGVYRLTGHRGVITGLRFWSPGGEGEGGDYLITSSLDGYVKVWDLGTQRCVQTIVGHRGQVTSMDIFVYEEGARLVTGSQDRRIRVWNLEVGEGDDVAEYMGR